MDLITNPEVGCFEDLGTIGRCRFQNDSCQRLLAFSTDYRRRDNRTGETSTPLAPMHNPRLYRVYPSLSRIAPNNTARCCFLRTWFHQTIPDYAAEFGVPRFWVEQHDIRRYGYHGASHRYISERVPQLLGRETGEGLRIISCHLGGSSSLCAIKDGESIDTSMGTSNAIRDDSVYPLWGVGCICGAVYARQRGILYG